MARDPRIEPPTEPPARAGGGDFARIEASIARLAAPLEAMRVEQTHANERIGRLEASLAQRAAGAPAPLPRARDWPPASPSIADLPPMRQKLASLEGPEALMVRQLSEAVEDDFDRNLADKSTPPPGGASVKAMVKERAKIMITEMKAAQWDRLEAAAKAAEVVRLDLLAKANQNRLDLEAQNARERVRVKWVAVTGVITTAGLLAAMLIQQCARVPLPARGSALAPTATATFRGP
jgi:hypothetical protein